MPAPGSDAAGDGSAREEDHGERAGTRQTAGRWAGGEPGAAPVPALRETRPISLTLHPCGSHSHTSRP